MKTEVEKAKVVKLSKEKQESTLAVKTTVKSGSGIVPGRP